MALSFKHIFTRGILSPWTGIELKEIHAKQVINADHGRRLFCLFDQDYPYDLVIRVRHMEKKLVARPGMGNGGMVVTFGYETSTEETLVRRYKTEEDARSDCLKVISLRDKYRKYIETAESEYLKNEKDGSC